MRIRFALSVPVLAMLACTGAGTSDASTSAATRPASSAAARARASAPANWPGYHGYRLRTGHATTMPTASGAPKISKRYALDGNVYASPIVINGRIVVATENNTVYAIQSGRIVWRRHLGTPAPADQLPCGNIFPLGITGTPVYANGRVYVAPEFGGPPRHQLYALRLSTGAVVWHHSLDRRGVETKAMQQRGALTYAGGRVWVPFGGLAGDCGNYKGRVVGARMSGSHGTIAYTVPTAREAGIWATPGALWDGTELFVAVGNGASTSPPYDGSDSVVAIGTDARRRQFFAPSVWASDNAADLDLGSQGPAVVGKWVFAAGKRGIAYVLNRSHLGGIGGAVSSKSLCSSSFGGTAVVGSRVYVPCTDGLRAVRIDSTGHLHRIWHAASQIIGSPVVGGGRVWSLDPGAGVLYELNPTTGGVVHQVGVGATSRFATPAIYGRRMFIPTLSGLTVVTTS